VGRLATRAAPILGGRVVGVASVVVGSRVVAVATVVVVELGSIGAAGAAIEACSLVERCEVERRDVDRCEVDRREVDRARVVTRCRLLEWLSAVADRRVEDELLVVVAVPLVSDPGDEM